MASHTFLLLLLRMSVLLAVVTGYKEQKFAMQPQDQTAVVGSRVTLPCRVINKGGMLQWTKDDFGLGTHRNLSGFDRYMMIGSDEEGECVSFILLLYFEHFLHLHYEKSMRYSNVCCLLLKYLERHATPSSDVALRKANEKSNELKVSGFGASAADCCWLFFFMRFFVLRLMHSKGTRDAFTGGENRSDKARSLLKKRRNMLMRR